MEITTEIKKVTSLEELNALEKGVIVNGLAASPFNSPIPRIYAGKSKGMYSFLNSLDNKGNVTVNESGKVVFEENEEIGDFRIKLREKTQSDRDLEKDYEVYFADCVCDIVGYKQYKKDTKEYKKKLKIIKEALN